MSESLKGKHIVLGISGGIAAYKSVILLRLLVKEGAEVQTILTPSAKEFITPVTLSSLSQKPVIIDFFNANNGEWHSHVDLGLWADLMVIAPATANSIAKMANGIADNMLLTSYLSARSPVMIAPAMDLDMWKHPATQNNLRKLQEIDVKIVEPEAGELASGLIGKGRMEDPEKILTEIKKLFATSSRFKGKKVMVTAGPTYENIDPVRFIGNYSSGKMGFAIAEAFANEGAEVFLITGPTNLGIIHSNIKRINITTAIEMLRECEKVYNQCDIAVFSAAVADYRPAKIEGWKIKREKEEEIEIRLVRNPDIAAEMGKRKQQRINIGFALETDNEEFNAQKKLKDKNFDFIVLNSLKDAEAGFNKDTNKVTIYTKEGEKKVFEAKSKRDVANDILNTLTVFLENTNKKC